ISTGPRLSRQGAASAVGSGRARTVLDPRGRARRPRPWSKMERVTSPARIRISAAVVDAVSAGEPVVALESTVITHGLPRPRNLEAGLELEAVVRAAGALPATVGIISG